MLKARVKCFSTGEAQEEVKVTLDATRLGAAGLSVADVATAIRNTDSKIPAGQLRAGRNDLLIEVAGELKQIDQIRNIPITRLSDGRILRVRDVGEVHRGRPRSITKPCSLWRCTQRFRLCGNGGKRAHQSLGHSSKVSTG